MAAIAAGAGSASAGGGAADGAREDASGGKTEMESQAVLLKKARWKVDSPREKF